MPFVYLEATDKIGGKKNGQYNRRGEADGDVQSFARLMARKGLAVALSDADLGDKVSAAVIDKLAKKVEV